jgi:hypothetical protein
MRGGPNTTFVIVADSGDLGRSLPSIVDRERLVLIVMDLVPDEEDR